MTLSTPRARALPAPGPLLVALLAFALAGVSPSTAGAQGRCSCNSGCHMFPGQCVQPGSAGCESGFAPFCATRATSCPNLGWVSCGGECTCVRVAPLDAGTPDAGAADVAMSIDLPVPADRSTPADAPVATDVRPTTDAPAAMDAPTASDSSAPSDLPNRDAVAAEGGSPRPDAGSMAVDTPGAPTDQAASAPDLGNATFDGGGSSPDVASASDATESGPDASTASDGGCACAGGGCAAGVCYRDRCTFNAELGFVCTTPGTACRLFGADPICVPVCAGVTCAGGQFCDERSNGACVVDRCAAIACPSGTTCLHNQCGRWSGADGGVFVPKDADVGGDGGASVLPTATETGCGCRVGDRSAGGRGGALGAVLVALVGWARARRRRVIAKGAARSAG